MPITYLCCKMSVHDLMLRGKDRLYNFVNGHYQTYKSQPQTGIPDPIKEANVEEPVKKSPRNSTLDDLFNLTDKTEVDARNLVTELEQKGLIINGRVGYVLHPNKRMEEYIFIPERQIRIDAGKVSKDRYFVITLPENPEEVLLIPFNQADSALYDDKGSLLAFYDLANSGSPNKNIDSPAKIRMISDNSFFKVVSKGKIIVFV